MNKGFAAIGLDNPPNAINVGHVLRAATCYNAAFVVATGVRYRQSATDTTNYFKHSPLIKPQSLRDVIPHDCVPVAIDLIPGAIPLNEYDHPERAFYVFGAEDATLGNRVTEWCRDTVYVPTNGCMNLAATVNVVLYDGLAKELSKREKNTND